jgi:hypothetical protein
MFSRLAVIVVVTVLAVPGTSAAFGADKVSEHCEAMGHDCGGLVLKACCCDSGQANPSLPATPAGGRTASSDIAAACVATSIVALPPTDADVSLAAFRLHSPPRGYHSVDLSLLHSVFLI